MTQVGAAARLLNALPRRAPSVHQLRRASKPAARRSIASPSAPGLAILWRRSGLLSLPQLLRGVNPVLPPVPFTSKEIAALVWAVKEAGNRQPFRAALSTALPKVQALVANREGRMGLAIEGAVGGWTRGVKDYTALEPLILELVRAIVSQTRCRVSYQSPSRKQPRTYPFDPYRVLSVHGGLYCVGFGPEHRHFITLAVDRIYQLGATGETFQVSPASTPKRLERRSLRRIVGNPMHVVLCSPPIRLLVGREWHPSQQSRPPRCRVELAFTAGGNSRSYSGFLAGETRPRSFGLEEC